MQINRVVYLTMLVPLIAILMNLKICSLYPLVKGGSKLNRGMHALGSI